MTLPRLIAFCGYATAGKDAAADQFVKNDGYVKTYMSKPLEKALLTLDPMIDLAKPGAVPLPVRYSAFHAAVGYDKTKEHYEVRRLLQTLGTEIGREMFDPDVWVRLAEKDIQTELWNHKSVCITGVRYPNELSMVRQFDGITVWVDRPGVVAVNTHSSDNTIGPEDCDIIVNNDGSLDDMYRKIKRQLWIKGYTPQGISAYPNEPIGEVVFCVYDTVLGNYMCLVHNEIVRKAGQNFDPVRVACSHDKNRPKG